MGVKRNVEEKSRLLLDTRSFSRGSNDPRARSYCLVFTHGVLLTVKRSGRDHSKADKVNFLHSKWPGALHTVIGRLETAFVRGVSRLT